MTSFFLTKDILFKFSFLIRSHKRLVILCFAFITICLYSIYIFFPLHYSFRFTKEYVETSSLDVCINDRLANYAKKLNEFDAVRYSDHSSVKYFSFIGNGYFGVSKDSGSSVLIRNDRGLSLETNIYPFIGLSVPDYRHKENTVLDFLAGELITFQCYKQSSLCISITSTSFAHRSRPQLLVQEVRVHNPTKSAVQIAVKKNAANAKNLNSLQKMTIVSVDYELFVQNVTVNDESSKSSIKTYVVVYARPVFPSYLSIPLTGDKTFTFISGIEYQLYTKSKGTHKFMVEAMVTKLVEDLKESLQSSIADLKFEHESVWKSLWKTGISTDRSLAPGALNGHHINSTIYYLLSNAQAYLHLKHISSDQRDYYRSFMHKPFHCYNNHDTLYVTNLWSLVVTQADLISQVNRWMVMLRKYGCGLFIKSGAHGLMQAIVYSAGSFNFAGDHISFGMHPNDLQRRIHFRNLQYKTSNSTMFNVLVDLNEDNRPQLWVSVSDTKMTLYACDAGCIDEPVTLRKSFVAIPVKLTVPKYPILYVSDQMRHIHDLKHVVHFDRIEEAPAHKHQVISMHKHGHSWGGLPPLFWICVVLLVLCFHLFLCKIIYSEYCRYRDDYDFSVAGMRPGAGALDDRHRYLPSTRRSQYYRDLH